MLRAIVFVSSCLVLFTACGDDGDGTGGGAGLGAAGATAGTPATAGTTVPTAGTLGGAGVTAGAAAAGSGGMAAPGGSGGAAAGAGGGAAGGGAGMGATGAPTFSAIFEEIIAGTGCNGGPTCHSGPAAGMLIMNNKAEAYTALIDQPAMGMNLLGGGMHCKDSGLKRVVAGQPDMSLLYKKISMTMPPCGMPMPPSPPLLTAAQQMQVRTWIMNGAMNN